MKLLHVDSSILGPGSVSRELTALIMARLTAGGGAEVIYRDLAAEALPHMSAASLPGAHPLSATAEPQDDAARAVRETSDRLLEEFLAADTVVIGAPMYNFGLPTQLKAWIDRLLVPGRTFRYGANGPEGLAGEKRVIVALARGGFYGPGTAQVSAEHVESYLRTVLGFVGVRDPEFVLAEGIASGEHNKSRALASARDAVGQLAA
ncbi:MULTISPECIES: FMN-dependent NADH-azoreductase [Methylobacterium]|uniref:FMN dependent NADH:quinone oxidoreductase n=2 Tax=Pseudomonadota TaxID=1224 RepID=A0ABQ4SVC1_9HYPH|nr:MULTISPECIES: FMN-dependent NADH-azoreductase [Methylobacterium]PIU05573.1 MAG: FMN-dependent NADH-azoreductase [Methylobacterium sp. CG09_land_8_20_14_0_10_71_15]PIU14748.1 MAG: FMN-dependent NADH-azoreductase [Methylobacterium sp. CG08_land_8_20_14_0_20_71_15]GBU18398.1 NADH-azoreductase [Methylobacterium sp.]GJE05813.1 FMN-dependent NADH-azoreductase 1 [Methylobacterium jeotgali]